MTTRPIEIVASGSPEDQRSPKVTVKGQREFDGTRQNLVYRRDRENGTESTITVGGGVVGLCEPDRCRLNDRPLRNRQRPAGECQNFTLWADACTGAIPLEDNAGRRPLARLFDDDLTDLTPGTYLVGSLLCTRHVTEVVKTFT